MNGFSKKGIIRVTRDSRIELEDPVAIEKRLRILVNGRDVLKLYCSPVMIRELVVGFLMTEGIIKGNWCAERMSIEYGDEILVDVPAEGEVSLEGSTMTSGCAGGITFDREIIDDSPIAEGIRISSEMLKKLFGRFQKASGLYNITGCVHCAAISDGKSIMVLAEDIGRHNAVDKAVGYCILEGISLEDKIILVSGRLSSEMASKCSRWGIPIVLSRTAPTVLATEIAEKRGITMVGFVRGGRFNIYSHPYRIEDAKA